MTDIECPRCGHRALSVATPCPRCGHEFSAELIHPPVPGSARRTVHPARAIGGALAMVVAVGLAVRGCPADSGPGATLAASRSGDLPEPSAADTMPPTARSAIPAVPAPPFEPPLLRYATTWINLRATRAPRGPAVRVLNPGDSVLVDSLVGEWYRVVEQGRTVGYARRRLLAARHPAGGAGR